MTDTPTSELVKAAPERIFLQWYGDATHPDPSKGRGEVTWCKESVFEHDVEYVRVDRLEELEAVVEKLPEYVPEPECACYEYHGGHQPGCPMHGMTEVQIEQWSKDRQKYIEAVMCDEKVMDVSGTINQAMLDFYQLVGQKMGEAADAEADGTEAAKESP